MTKEIELAQHLHNLKLLVKTANDPKLLWEEMQILGTKAFNLQEKMDNLMDELEATTEEIAAIQMLADTREMMWDLMNQLASRELELKTKPHPHTCSHHHCCCHHDEKKTSTHKYCCKGKKKCQKK